jgi:signal transduction histidine kinase
VDVQDWGYMLLSTELQQVLHYTEQLWAWLEQTAQALGRRGTSFQIDGASVMRQIKHQIEIVQHDTDLLALQVRQYEELIRTTALITSSQSLNDVLEGVTDTIVKLAHAERAYLMIVDEHTQDLQIKTARNWDQVNIPEQEAQFSRSVVRFALERQQPVLTINALQDEQLQTLVSVLNYGLLSILCIPLLVRDKIIGVLYADSRIERRHFAPENEPLFVAFANQAAISIENARLFDQLRSYAERLSNSREQIITAREEERRRLRRDLHDSLGPMLASLTLAIDVARTRIRQGEEALAGELLNDVKVTIQTLLGEMRRIVYGLRPPILDEFGLAEAIRAYMLPLSIPDSRQMILAVETSLEGLSAALEVTLYRIVTEAVTNVVRHSTATFCEVRFFREGRQLCVRIFDNGQGFPPENNLGVGLRSMHERAAELGGTCNIESSRGVTITACFPV